MSDLEVDPTALRSASPKFSSTADKLNGAWEALRSVLDAEGECWGNDEPGQEFAKGYKPAADLGREAFPGITQGIYDIRTGLDESANTWESVDQGNAQAFGGQG